VDFEAEYNNRARVPEHSAIIAGWARDAAAYRAVAECELGIPYGARERQRYDYFHAAVPAGPRALAVFIHGGYWQALDRSYFSHMARGLNAHGVAVAVPSYDLCPDVTVAAIVEEMRALCRQLAERFARPLIVSGHSAGGHLACCMLATEWKTALPLVTAAYSISGLPELEPLVATSVNDALHLDADTARALSPRYWPAPKGLTLDLVVGAEESSEYLRQSRELADAWAAAGVTTRNEVVPGANHFSIIAPLADPASAMTRRLAKLAQPGVPDKSGRAISGHAIS
jgi:arylformamidase